MTSTETEPDLASLLDYLKEARGFDFTLYKRPTISRRIRSRLEATKTGSFPEYQRRLEDDPGEFAALFDAILINVTSFFRDPDTWSLVADEVVPRLVAGLPDAEAPLRVWIAGCASGQEAYTVAMLLCEALGEDRFRRAVKIYATDIDRDALADARRASFTRPSVVEHVPEPMVERYFVPDDGSLAFRKDLRRSIIFGRHDLIHDPPISRINLLVCRNTLMYFTAEAQRRILHSLTFAVADKGFLLLGRSEALASRSELFVPHNLRHRLFVRRPRRTLPPRPVPPAVKPGAGSQVSDESTSIRESGFDVATAVQLIVDHRGLLTAANRQARSVLGVLPTDVGRPLKDLQVSFRPLELRSRVEQAQEDREPVQVRNVEVGVKDERRVFDVDFIPLIGGDGSYLGVSVSFIDVTAVRRLRDELDRAQGELETAHEELQSTVEELETTNEELQSTNEELETTNEELQSTNEELETMNEELQSTNEELETINEELRQRTDDLNDVNIYLEAVLSSLQTAVVVVDREMRVDVWNARSRDLWGLRAEEVEGEHLMNLDIGLPVEALRKPILSCLNGEGEPADQMLRAVNRRGRAVDVRVQTAPLHGRNRDILGVILLMDAVEVDDHQPS